MAFALASLLVIAGPAAASGRLGSRMGGRQLLKGTMSFGGSRNTTAAVPANTTAANTTSTVPDPTTPATNVTGNATLPPIAPPLPPLPPTSPLPPPPGTAKDKLEEKWKKLESGKSPAEQGIAITVGVLMLVSIITCLVCCVFRRGGQWRVPGLQWIKARFGKPKDKYSRYMETNDDGF